MITIQASYPVATYIILPVVTAYCGIYLNLSNHYILRPKIEPLLERLSVSSALVIEIMVDILSNLSFISYAIFCCLLTRPSDQPIRIIQLYNLYWLTICLAVVMYFRVANPLPLNLPTVVFCKNGLILLLCYVNIMYHYFSATSFITLPSILVGLYVINVALAAYEDKFISFVYELLSIEDKPLPQPKQKMISHLPTIEYLSANYPVSNTEIDEKLEQLKEKSANQLGGTVSKNKNNRPIFSKIDTKMMAREKLMRICLCVHLSMAKKEQQEIQAVRQYYGLMNGTISDDEATKPKKPARQHKTYFNSRNKDKENLISKPAKKDQLPKFAPGHETTDMALAEGGEEPQEESVHIEGGEGLESESLLYYVFPIRILEFSRVISAVFSIVANLGFGILLGYCQSVMNTLSFGRFAEFALAALLLPIIPRVSMMQFINTLSLATIWKFAVFGLFALISATTDPSGDATHLNWTMSADLQYACILLVIALGVGLTAALVGKNKWKLMVLVFLVASGLMGWITYLSIASTNNNTT